MMVLMKIHRRILIVVVLTLWMLCNNCVFSQRSSTSNNNEDEQQKQQQQQQQLLQSATTLVEAKTNDTQQQAKHENGEVEKQVLVTNESTNNSNNKNTTSTSSSSSYSSSTTASSPPPSTSRRNSSEININNKYYGESNEEDQNSAEILNESEDAIAEHSASITPTTYRPARSSVAPLISAQDRERKLMNVLAARRNALHRGGFRTRIGTTGRTAISSGVIETTSKSPTDPRSICIRNCTKNFTRRTTASCMRQCANFSRNTTNGALNSTATVIVRPSSKTGSGTQSGDRDTNEILFTDESSHGLFVVAKDQNDTLNHISDVIKGAGIVKFRGRGKHPLAVTLATTSIEDDDIQPYLYFGQKLPPIKPAMLTITSVSDDHPKLLEVSVSRFPSTTPAPAASSTLSAVERSRSRYKYNMRDRSSNSNFNRRYGAVGRPTAALLSDNSAMDVKASTLSSPIAVNEKPKDQSVTVMRVSENQKSNRYEDIKEPIVTNLAAAAVAAAAALEQPASSTPLIINVLSDEDEMTQSPVANTTEKLSTTTSSTTTTTTSTTTTTTTTTTIAPPTPKPTEPSTTSTTTTTTLPSASVTTTTITSTTAKSPSSTPTIAALRTTPKRKTIIEEDTERLRALGPSLTQVINTDEKTNLIIFVNHTTGTTETTTRRIPVSYFSSTDPTLSILRTTVLSSVRSTVNPRTSSTNAPASRTTTTTTTTTTTANNGGGTATYVGIIESAPEEESSLHHQPSANGADIRSTVVADEREVSIDVRRMNIATMVLAGIGIFPLCAIILYFVRSFIIRRNAKDEEDFDVCITDQQPISPVKKLDSKYHNNEDEDEVDHHIVHHMTHQTQLSKSMQSRGDSNHNNNNNNNNSRYDEQCSVTSDQEFDRGNIRLKSLLGEGNFGQVWKAEADDLSGHFGATRIVAVKTIRACSAQATLKDEANIMRKLGSHQNVVTLLGACVESEPHMLIMEYAMRGRLLSLLRAARSATNILPASVPGGRSLAPLSPRTLAGFALDIACGMEYIAERRIVHRDLAARNILLDHNGVCKICDFGMSIDLDAERKKKEQEKNCANEIMHSNSNKFKFDFRGRFILTHWNNNFGNQHENQPTQNSHNQQQKESSSATDKKGHHGHHGHGHGHGHDTISKRHALPIRWMAPEALQYHMFTTETDIWAFGIVLWEIATLGSTPYSQLTGREVIRRVPNGMRPDLPKEGRHEFYNLMARCWHKDPNMRPSFTQSRLEVSRSLHKWVDDDSAASDYMDVSGFSEDLEHGMVYFNHRISEFECEI